MKLHLPSSLRKALLTCLAALAPLFPATLSVGVMGSIASAEWTNPPITFPDAANASVNENQYLNLDSINATNLYGNIGGSVSNPHGYTGGAGKNLKINKAGPNYTTRLRGDVHVDTLWLTSSAPFSANQNKNSFEILEGFLTSDIKNIYINNAGFDLLTANTNLNANFYIGKIVPIPAGQKGESGLSDGGSWGNITVKLENGANLETTGDLHIQEDLSTLLTNAHLKARSLQGAGTWTIGGTDSENSYFEFTQGGSLGGELVLATVHGNTTRAHQIRLGASLALGGIVGSMGEFVSTGGGDVAVILTGQGGEATNITFTNVGVSLGESASHTLTDSSIGGSVSLGANSQLSLVNTPFRGYMNVDAGSRLSLSGVSEFSLSGLSGSGAVVVDSECFMTIENSLTDAGESNTFSGDLDSRVSLELLGGYQAFSCVSADEYSISLKGGSITVKEGMVAVGIGADGKVGFNLWDGAVLDMTAARSLDGAAVTYRQMEKGTSTIVNLVLEEGDVIKFAEKGDGHIILDTPTFRGGTIAFNVVGGETGVSGTTGANLGYLTYRGVPSYADGAAHYIKLEIAPYGRTTGGEVVALNRGTYLLIENFGNGDLQKYGELPTPPGRTEYKYSVKDGNLYLVVDVAVGKLTWTKENGGDWKSASSWIYEGETDVFQDGDTVIFDTIIADEATGESVSGPVAVTIDPEEVVLVGGITVKGDTSYELDGDIAGAEGDVGLVVGIMDNSNSRFRGTLILNGNNSWKGDNALNSGTIIVRHTHALSDVETSVGSAAKLEIDCEGELAGTLNVQGGVVSSLHDVELRAVLHSGVVSAAEETVLTIHRIESENAGYLRVNEGEATGRVNLLLGGESASSALSVNAGLLTLSKEAEDTAAVYTVSGNVSIAEGARVVVENGVTLSGNLRSPQGELTMEKGSALVVTGTESSVGALISHGSTLTGSSEGAGTVVEELLVDANTTLRGGWDIRTLQHAKGTITIAGGSTVIASAGEQGVGRLVAKAGVSLTAGSASAPLSISQLELGSKGGATATLAGGSSVVTPSLTATNGEIAPGAVVTLTAPGKEKARGAISGSGANLRGEVQLLNGAELSISDDAAMDGALIITSGSVSVSSAAAAGTALLSGPAAHLNFNNCAAGTEVTMASGAELLGTGRFAGTIIVDDTDASVAAGEFALGGLGGNAGVQLKGLRSTGRVTGLAGALNLVGDSDITLSSAQRSRENALIRFDGDAPTGAYTKASGATLTIHISSLLSAIMKEGELGSTYYVFNKGVTGTDWMKETTTFDADFVLNKMDVAFDAVNGSLTFTYHGPIGGLDVFYSSEAGESSVTHVNSYDALDAYAGVVLDRNMQVDLKGATMDMDHADGLVLRNLTGTADSALSIVGDGSNATLVTIRNTISDAEVAQYIKDHPGLNINNMFTVSGDVAVDEADLQVSHKAADGTLLTTSRTRMAGALHISGGQLRLESGELELTGRADVEEVAFTGGTCGQLIVSGASVSVGSVSLNPFAEQAESAHEEHIRLEKNSLLEIKTGSTVDSGIIIGNAKEPLGGTVSMEGKSIISAGAALQNVVLHLQENSRLTVAPAITPRAMEVVEPEEVAWNIAGLTGSGELASPELRNLSIRVLGEDCAFSGNLASYRGTMTIGSAEKWQIFDGVLGGEAWSLTNTAGGRVMLNLMGKRARNSVTMDALTLASGSVTVVQLDMFNLTPGSTGLELTTLSVEDGASVTFAQHGEGMISLEGENGELQRIELGSIAVAEESSLGEAVQWKLEGVRNYEQGSLKAGIDSHGVFYLEAVVDDTNIYAAYADEENAAAGADMLWAAKNAGGDLSKLDAAVGKLLLGTPTEADIARANSLLAAAAGASTAALGDALGADLERQLRAIRNRTASLTYGAERESSVWLNAESNYHKQNADGLLPGFKLNGWGGTLGAHTELRSAHTTLGMALTAMYNDVESQGAERLKGDMDTYYLSAFAQVAHRSWRHTFIASVGTVSVDVKRTVNYGDDSYTNSATTDGFALGLLYEVGYTVPLRADYTVCLQPVVNVAWRLTNIDSYTESGGTAALSVAEQSYSAVTFGAGFRMQAAMGSRAWNSVGLLEARALVKVDTGDRCGRADTAFALVPDAVRGSVKSAERGAVGVELGAGITVPTGAAGSIFADFSAELRSGYTDLNATLGYKINF